MCLDVKRCQESEIAKTDIICYKVLVKKKGKLRTYFIKDVIELGKTYSSPLRRYDLYFSSGSSVEQGLHSFKTYLGAWLFTYIHNPFEFRNKIVKCVIPKGSKYYLGKFQGLRSYASDTLKYIK